MEIGKSNKNPLPEENNNCKYAGLNKKLKLEIGRIYSGKWVKSVKKRFKKIKIVPATMWSKPHPLYIPIDPHKKGTWSHSCYLDFSYSSSPWTSLGIWQIIGTFSGAEIWKIWDVFLLNFSIMCGMKNCNVKLPLRVASKQAVINCS